MGAELALVVIAASTALSLLSAAENRVQINQS
jgi:hypothetical protein